MEILTLLTDFGTTDYYLASLKGSILKYKRDINIVDICHNIPPYEIEKGSFLLYASYKNFPEGTYHLAIIDPGVGTFRDFLYMEKEGHHFFAPDNGLLTLIYDPLCLLFKVIFPDKWIKEASSTFHGRDLFGPAVGLFIKGKPLEMVPKANPILFSYKKPHKSKKGIVRGSIIHIDIFGNCITDIPVNLIEFGKGKVKVKDIEINFWSNNYLEIPEGKLGLLKGSLKTLEIARNKRSAKEILEVSFGEEVLYFPK